MLSQRTSMGQSIFAILATLIVGFAVNASVRVISGGEEALVERFGKYKRTLKPGLHFMIPFIEKIACVDTTRERVLDIAPQSVITADNVSLQVDAVVYWRILILEKAFYAIDQIENAIASLVLTTFRSEIGRMPMQNILSARDEINRMLLRKLDDATHSWGVKVIRVEIQSLTPPQKVQAAMEMERAAQSERLAMIRKAEGTKESMMLLLQVLESHPQSKEILQFLLAEKYVEATNKLGESGNAKILFMDPKAMSDALRDLMGSLPDTTPSPNGNHQPENGTDSN